MTYLVLARKWRPRSFDTLIGQDHVVRALTHALATGRLHHAWLFTGTRGVGKTTLSRLLAKSLNCETGITATPCGVCRACTEIDTGRFVDYLELDAASNRGVDEMTQLLEQAVYSPSVGRFKVYMIDEVHMLTGHAFNAMLKTLEEPPPHVKFILATTDPQKIPVTVLSRCLQFNLKQMTADAIVSHLEGVLGQEEIGYETPALRLIARAASGSMRDALSLADQAIAYSAANLSADAVQAMLGTIDQRHLIRLLQALSAASGTEVLQVADELAARGLSYSGALADLAVLLSRIAIEQRVAGTVSDDDPMAADIADLARTMHPDLVQLFYSVAVHSRHELSLAPDEYAGFVMACLRMLALAPVADPGTDKAAGVDQEKPAAATATTQVASPTATSSPAASLSVASSPAASSPAAPAVPVSEPALSAVSPSHDPVAVHVQGGRAAAIEDELRMEANADERGDESNEKRVQEQAEERIEERVEERVDHHEVAAWEDDPRSDSDFVRDAGDFDEPAANIDDPRDSDPADYDIDPSSDRDIGALVDDIVAPDRAPSSAKTRAPRLRDMTAGNWPPLAGQLPLTGLAAELARQSEWLGSHKDTVMLRVAVRTLAESPGKSRLCTVLSEHFGKVVQLQVEYGATGDETAHAHEQAQRALKQQEAERAARADPFVLTLINEFGARLIPDSVRPGPDKASMAKTA